MVVVMCGWLAIVGVELEFLGADHSVQFVGEGGDVLACGESHLLLKRPVALERHDGLGTALVSDLVVVWLHELVETF